MREKSVIELLGKLPATIKSTDDKLFKYRFEFEMIRHGNKSLSRGWCIRYVARTPKPSVIYSVEGDSIDNVAKGMKSLLASEKKKHKFVIYEP